MFAGYCNLILYLQYRFDITGHDEDIAMISLMQKDKRMEKSRGADGDNLTIGFFVVQVRNHLNFVLLISGRH